MLSPICAALIVGLVVEYHFDMTQFIAIDIYNREVGTNLILAFPCILTQIYLEIGMLELLDIDQYI